jgi:hypothetical protein
MNKYSVLKYGLMLMMHVFTILALFLTINLNHALYIAIIAVDITFYFAVDPV